ncbi:uncharacterized protein L969DRAFT_86933 [Mixia osmundae IAM 14324]|uniref:Glycosyl transferase CAP10 domain-containing protein n=1 Tax=Mixia osmundae (strain CBS 9802 / IAM 14324 / JCM 22182 / KY 12970) TaxID=764103 RepID=G7E938_MIXOS|nr:uncharacterized protein L969DRAFT_86933 [Mixia osmundae IAM 14324]KEI40292.1 hypothetical protein L969DRAFT_86933 [Mixia osmundae IAM 14324]GAA99656.1 hypothetical protein E5Q_06359 [Mixia osmundae IAM 14324]
MSALAWIDTAFRRLRARAEQYTTLPSYSNGSGVTASFLPTSFLEQCPCVTRSQLTTSACALLLFIILFASSLSQRPPPAYEYRGLPVLARHMNQSTCHGEFPDLYREAERAAQYWRHRGGITRAALDAADAQAHARVLIKDNQVYLTNYRGGINSRTLAALASLNEAVLTAVEELPAVEFVIQTDDSAPIAGAAPRWVFARTDEEDELALWLMPDFGHYAWPEPGVGSMAEVQAKASAFEAAQTWSSKIPKLFWRGALVNPLRDELIRLSDENRGSWGDAKALDWGRLEGELRSPAQHCAYKYLAHAEGFAYSGRLKYILQCRSVVVMHKLRYTQHFHHLLNYTGPQQNAVLVEGPGWQGLELVMRDLMEHDDHTRHLAQHSFEYWHKWLSPPSIDCYWRQLFWEWSALQRFTPELTDEFVPYASFDLMRATKWDIH